MSPPVTVICVLFSGERADLPSFSKGVYSPEWVDKLYRGVARNTSQRFRFVCLVDDPSYVFEEPVEALPLMDPTAGWMTLLEAFRPGLGVDRGIVLGLDTVINGSLDDLFAYDGAIGLVRDPFFPTQVCNAVCSVDRATANVLWSLWDADREGWKRRCTLFGQPSEMQFLRQIAGESCDLLDARLPGQIVSFKCHVEPDPKSLEEARVVYFHGVPKPHQLTGQWEAWLAETWR